MKKFLTIFAVASGLLCCGTLQAEAMENGNRPFYGFFLSNAGDFTNAKAGSYGFARQTFDAPGLNELIHPITGNIGVYAATAIDGVYYAAPYLFESSMSMPVPQPMFSYNIYTGLVTTLGDWSDKTTDLKPSDMTYDRKNDRLLAICYGSTQGAGIYEVNRETGAMKLLRKVDQGGVIAADAFGRVFSINHQGQLSQIDMTKDNTSHVIYQLPFAYLSSNQSLEFDLTSNKLYWASNTLENPNADNAASTWLVEISLPTIAPTADYTADLKGYDFEILGEIGRNARFQGMFIPYATGGFDAPGFATDTKSESSADGTYVTLSFKTPATTFGGKPLAGFDGYDIYRDGVRIETVKGACGPLEAKIYEDRNVPATGREYRYDIVCYSNTKGDGPKSPIYAYVGFDAPKAVAEAEVKVSDDFLSTTLTWEAPTVGMHGGTFDPSKTVYDVKRLPDNVMVAENIKECSVNDNLRRLLRYNYEITAKNESGSSKAYTEEFIAGPPVEELPLEENFDNPTVFNLRWNSVDNNGDGLTWLYGMTFGHDVFGDYETAAEYVVSPTSIDAYTQDADEWIITPPIKFASGVKYGIDLKIRTLTPESLEIHYGPKNTVEGMKKVCGFNVHEPEFDDETGMRLFSDYSFELPDDIAGTTACVAVRLTTPLEEPYVSFMQIGNIVIGDRTAGVRTDLADSDATYRIDGGDLLIRGDIRDAAIYSLTGMKLRDITSPRTSLATLSGVVILKLNNRAYKLAL